MNHLFGSTLRDYLSGAWRIERIIEDRLAQGNARFEGEATFSPSRTELDYRETGLLTLAGRSHQATQSYRWTFDEAGIASVSFTDGRPFHTVALDGTTATAHHNCPPDDYSVAYDFRTLDVWHQTWRVTGPRKDYTSRSVFTRLHRPTQSLLSAE